jgi:hypothetical protein
MQRIATSTRARDLFGVLIDGYQDVDTVQGTPPTELSGTCMNADQEELARILDANSEATSTSDNGQAAKLLADLRASRWCAIPNSDPGFVVSALACDQNRSANTFGLRSFGTLVAVGGDIAGYSSDRGRTWTTANLGSGANLHDVAVNANQQSVDRWVAVGDNGIWTNQDIWSDYWGHSYNGVGGPVLRAVAWLGGTRFLAAGDDGLCLLSPDGFSWDVVTMPDAFDLCSIATDTLGKIVIGANDSGVGYLYISTDGGTTFTRAFTGGAGPVIGDGAYDSGLNLFAFVDDAGGLLTSDYLPDGFTRTVIAADEELAVIAVIPAPQPARSTWCVGGATGGILFTCDDLQPTAGGPVWTPTFPAQPAANLDAIVNCFNQFVGYADNHQMVASL